MIADMLHKFCTIFNQMLFPTKCMVCGSFFQPPNEKKDGLAGEPDLMVSVQATAVGLLSAHLCAHCVQGLASVESPLCICCGLPFKSRHGMDHCCGDCVKSPKKFRIARAPMVYEKIFTEVIHCYKYKGKIQLARPLAGLLLAAFKHFWDQDGIDVIIPVPLHLKRFRQRGFNQAYLLVQKWQTMAGFDCSAFKVERDVLVRTVATAPQTGLGRKERAANIKDAFDLADETKIIDKRILLVDDVYTTGATVNECARLLLARGATHVDVLSLARAV